MARLMMMFIFARFHSSINLVCCLQSPIRSRGRLPVGLGCIGFPQKLGQEGEREGPLPLLPIARQALLRLLRRVPMEIGVPGERYAVQYGGWPKGAVAMIHSLAAHTEFNGVKAMVLDTFDDRVKVKVFGDQETVIALYPQNLQLLESGGELAVTALGHGSGRAPGEDTHGKHSEPSSTWPQDSGNLKEAEGSLAHSQGHQPARLPSCVTLPACLGEQQHAIEEPERKEIIQEASAPTRCNESGSVEIPEVHTARARENLRASCPATLHPKTRGRDAGNYLHAMSRTTGTNEEGVIDTLRKKILLLRDQSLSDSIASGIRDRSVFSAAYMDRFAVTVGIDDSIEARHKAWQDRDLLLDRVGKQICFSSRMPQSSSGTETSRRFANKQSAVNASVYAVETIISIKHDDLNYAQIVISALRPRANRQQPKFDPSQHGYSSSEPKDKLAVRFETPAQKLRFLALLQDILNEVERGQDKEALA